MLLCLPNRKACIFQPLRKTIEKLKMVDEATKAQVFGQ